MNSIKLNLKTVVRENLINERKFLYNCFNFMRDMKNKRKSFFSKIVEDADPAWAEISATVIVSKISPLRLHIHKVNAPVLTPTV